MATNIDNSFLFNIQIRFRFIFKLNIILELYVKILHYVLTIFGLANRATLVFQYDFILKSCYIKYKYLLDIANSITNK